MNNNGVSFWDSCVPRTLSSISKQPESVRNQLRVLRQSIIFPRHDSFGHDQRAESAAVHSDSRSHSSDARTTSIEEPVYSLQGLSLSDADQLPRAGERENARYRISNEPAPIETRVHLSSPIYRLGPAVVDQREHLCERRESTEDIRHGDGSGFSAPERHLIRRRRKRRDFSSFVDSGSDIESGTSGESSNDSETTGCTSQVQRTSRARVDGNVSGGGSSSSQGESVLRGDSSAPSVRAHQRGRRRDSRSSFGRDKNDGHKAQCAEFDGSNVSHRAYNICSGSLGKRLSRQQLERVGVSFAEYCAAEQILEKEKEVLSVMCERIPAQWRALWDEYNISTSHRVRLMRKYCDYRERSISNNVTATHPTAEFTICGTCRGVRQHRGRASWSNCECTRDTWPTTWGSYRPYRPEEHN